MVTGVTANVHTQNSSQNSNFRAQISTQCHFLDALKAERDSAALDPSISTKNKESGTSSEFVSEPQTAKPDMKIFGRAVDVWGWRWWWEWFEMEGLEEGEQMVGRKSWFLHICPTLGEDGSPLKPSLSYCGWRGGGRGETMTGKERDVTGEGGRERNKEKNYKN